MHIRKSVSLLHCTAVSLALAKAALAVPAFSGATGPGASATGGRGGDVYHVTRLDIDLAGAIPGSLKYGLNHAPSAGRTIVFDVGGTIFQNGGGAQNWFRDGNSNITIAGQTAPGPGITIAGTGTKWNGNNVILRNITARPNKDPVNPTNFTYDGFSLQTTNSIVDHVTATWSTDEAISLTDAGANTTVQYSHGNEGLNYAAHAFGSIISTQVNGTHYQYDHNLFAHNSGRMPAIGSETGSIGAITNYANNVIYNWPATKAGYSSTGQHSSTNFVGNYHIKGPSNGVLVMSFGDDATSVGFTQFFQSKTPAWENKSDINKNGIAGDGVAYAPGDTMPNGQSYYSGSVALVTSPFAVTGMVMPDPADVALSRVLAYSGANWNHRNPIDQRIIDSVATGTGKIITDLTGSPQVSEWATVLAQQAAVTRPANFDTDQDGMPDEWEAWHGLNPTAASNNGDFDSDGYTNLEEYINELSEWPAASPILFNAAASTRFALINNWHFSATSAATAPDVWQPSKYDTAVINTGTCVVDAVGQHAGTLKVGNVAGNTAVLEINSGWIDVSTQTIIGAVAGANGVINLGGGELRTPVLSKSTSGAFNMTGGTLRADLVNFTLANNGGTIAPGYSTRITAVNGDLTLSAGAVEIDLSGPARGAQFDALDVAGAANVGATLTLNLQAGYEPAYLVQHSVLHASSVGGAFAPAAPIQLSASKWLVVSYDADDVFITAALPGDANIDGVVNFDDLLLVVQNYELGGTQTWQSGDINGSGVVNFDDLLLVAQFYDASVLSAALTESTGRHFESDLALAQMLVPEPTSLVPASFCLLARRRR